MKVFVAIALLRLTANMMSWLLFVQILQLHFFKFIYNFHLSKLPDYIFPNFFKFLSRSQIGFNMNSAELVQFYAKPWLIVLLFLAICAGHLFGQKDQKNPTQVDEFNKWKWRPNFWSKIMGDILSFNLIPQTCICNEPLLS